MSTKERFATVRRLIAEKHFEEARFILDDIGDTQAQEWLWRVDDLEGKHNRNRRLMFIGVLVVVFILLIGGLAISFVVANQRVGEIVQTLNAP